MGRHGNAIAHFVTSLDTHGHTRRAVSQHATLAKALGRIDSRHCIAFADIGWLDLLGLKAPGPKLASIARIESTLINDHSGRKARSGH